MFFLLFDHSICLILAERCDQVADYEEGVKSRTQELEVGQTIGISKVKRSKLIIPYSYGAGNFLVIL